MVFKRMPRAGTEIPADRRPAGSINATLAELPAYREHTHDLKGVPLYLPRTGLVVVPVEPTPEAAWNCVVMIGHGPYPRGGYNLYVSRWELQRALVVVLDLKPVSTHPDSAYGGVQVMQCMDGSMIKVQRSHPVVVPRDPDYVELSTLSGPLGILGTLPPVGDVVVAHPTVPGSDGTEYLEDGERISCRLCGTPLGVVGAWTYPVQLTDQGYECTDAKNCSHRMAANMRADRTENRS
ncbi:MAG: hypothetical protein HOY78_02630 [Saccharothrix sp.]|nr:hypothetical protein [Saccharothrix sp.]